MKRSVYRGYMINKDSLEIAIGNIGLRIVSDSIRASRNKADDLTHSHTSYELHHLLTGGASLEYEGGSIELSEGETLLLSPELFHRFSSEAEGALILSLSFYLERKISGDDLYSLVGPMLQNPPAPLRFKRSEAADECLKRITAGAHSASPFATETVKASLALLFTELFSQLAGDTPRKGNGQSGEKYGIRGFMIEEYFNRYYVDGASLSELSKLLSLSKKQTERAVKAAFGVGFREHLLRLRIKSAEELLSGSDREIREIAEAVGYSSYNGFYEIFKARVGISPEEYRREYRKKDTVIPRKKQNKA
jgi:AraC-like DNA-binding protein